MAFFADHISEPKRNFTFLLKIGGLPTFWVSKVDRPKVESGVIEHSYLNHKFKYPGRVSWKAVKITLVDPAGPDAAQTLMNILEKSGYFYPTSPDQHRTISRKSAIEATGEVSIDQLNAEGGVIERWTYVNAWIKDIDFDENTYEGEKLLNYQLTLEYDYAEIDLTGEAAEL